MRRVHDSDNVVEIMYIEFNFVHFAKKIGLLKTEMVSSDSLPLKTLE